MHGHYDQEKFAARPIVVIDSDNNSMCEQGISDRKETIESLSTPDQELGMIKSTEYNKPSNEYVLVSSTTFLLFLLLDTVVVIFD